MARIQRFEDLKIWQEAIEVAVDVYGISGSGKLKNDFGAMDQIRRSATSISNNIAEGFEYNNNRDFIRYLRFAKGSCGEYAASWSSFPASVTSAGKNTRIYTRVYFPCPNRSAAC